MTVYLLECLYNDIMVLDETMEDSFWDIAEASPVLRTHLYKMFSNFKLCEYLIWTNTLAFSLAILLLRYSHTHHKNVGMNNQGFILNDYPFILSIIRKFKFTDRFITVSYNRVFY